MANSDVPIPGSPLIFFFFITLGFLIFTLFSIQNAKSIDDIEKAKDGSLLTIIYVCVLIIGSYFINSTVSKAICNSEAVRWSNILLATLLPWIIIFFSLFIVLKIFPGWITPFSNTVGYVVISILGVENTLTAILNKNTGDSVDLAKAIANITHNKSNFINQIDINKATFLSFIGDLKKVGIITLNKSITQDEVAIQQQPGRTQEGGGGDGSAGKAVFLNLNRLSEIHENRTREAALAQASESPPKIAQETLAAASALASPSKIVQETKPNKSRGAARLKSSLKTTALEKAPTAPAAVSVAAAVPVATSTQAAGPGTQAAGPGTQAATEVAKDLGKPERELLTNPDIQNLYKLLVIKNVLGQITWYTLAGVLVSSVSYNYIINMSCDKSLEEITTELNNAEAASLDYAQKNR